MAKSPSVSSRAARRSPSTRPGTAEPPTDKPPIHPGQYLMFLYPTYPFHGITTLLEPHFVRVREVIDQRAHQIDQAEFDRQPLLLRSAWTIGGMEVHTGAPVSFEASYIQQLQIIPASAVKPRRWGAA